MGFRQLLHDHLRWLRLKRPTKRHHGVDSKFELLVDAHRFGIFSHSRRLAGVGIRPSEHDALRARRARLQQPALGSAIEFCRVQQHLDKPVGDECHKQPLLSHRQLHRVEQDRRHGRTSLASWHPICGGGCAAVRYLLECLDRRDPIQQ